MHVSSRSTRAVRVAALGLGLVALAAPAAVQATPPGSAAAPIDDWSEDAFRGQVQVVPGNDEQASVLRGTVFVDRDRDSGQDRGERGLRGVTVSNGRDVVTTDARGRYEIPVEDNMTVFVTQPRGYQVPVDEDNVAQFHYHHLPEGSPELRYGGLDPTGPLPEAVNFPVVRSQETQSRDQGCVIAGDKQTYTERQVEYARLGGIADLAARDDYTGCGALFIGDIVGDDLALFERTRELVSELNGPVRFLPGNHDLDFDAPTAEHSLDTYRAQLAPTYYSYDVGNTHVVALNTVRYPCTPEVDNTDGLRPECNDPENRPTYNGMLGEDQLAWLEADLATVPEDRLVVLASHIPLLTFADEGSPRHQVDQVRQVHELVGDRPAIAVAGHTHTIENMRTGDLFAGWQEIFGLEGLPFPHLVAGAISGDWYSGRVTDEGYPLAVGRDGGRPGLLTLDVTGNQVRERYTVTGEDPKVQTQLGLNTPHYRDWYEERRAWNRDRDGRAPELGDPLVVTDEDLAGTTWLTTNFWMGSTGATVEVSLDGGEFQPAARTQQARGEGQLVGPEWSDPAAVAEQLVHGGSVADRMIHLWRLELPADLEPGAHTAQVRATDVHGRTFTDSIEFEVVDER